MVSEKFEPLGLVVDKLKGFTKSTQEFTNGVLHNIGLSRRRRPVEILKRLQREAFSDIMKLRDRQDKVERILSFKSSKVSPLDQTSTRVKGEIEVLGLLLMIDRIHEENQDAIRRTGIKTGINSKFTFETTIRETDNLKAEFIASDKGQFDALTTPLSLSKVVFDAKINEWYSLTTALLGAKCSDLLKHGVTNGPPLLNQNIGSGVSLTMRKNNLIGSFAQFVSLQGPQLGDTNCLSTFGQLVYQLSGSTKVLLLGLEQVSKYLGQDASIGPMGFPIGIFRPDRGGTDHPFRSTALVLESELDSSTRVVGWGEMNNSDTGSPLKWGVSVSDLPEDDFGWGLRVGGSVFERFDVEVFSKVNLGDKFLLQPSIVYVADGLNKFPALMLKSSWSF